MKGREEKAAARKGPLSLFFAGVATIVCVLLLFRVNWGFHSPVPLLIFIVAAAVPPACFLTGVHRSLVPRESRDPLAAFLNGVGVAVHIFVFAR